MQSVIDGLFGRANAREGRLSEARPAIPTMRVAIVTCMDARIDVGAIFGFGGGEAHVLRNAGGLATDDMLRSLVLSQRLLETREIVLMHHADCGLHGADEAALRARILAETGSEPAYAFGSFADVDDAVRRAVVRVRTHPYLPYRDNVRGCVYEVETAVVREVSV